MGLGYLPAQVTTEYWVEFPALYRMSSLAILHIVSTVCMGQSQVQRILVLLCLSALGFPVTHFRGCFRLSPPAPCSAAAGFRTEEAGVAGGERTLLV